MGDGGQSGHAATHPGSVETAAQSVTYFDSLTNLIPATSYLWEMQDEGSWDLTKKNPNNKKRRLQPADLYNPLCTSLQRQNAIKSRTAASGDLKSPRNVKAGHKDKKEAVGQATRKDKTKKRTERLESRKIAKSHGQEKRHETPKSAASNASTTAHSENPSQRGSNTFSGTSQGDAKPSRDELLARLRAKIEAMRPQKRKNPSLNTSDAKPDRSDRKKHRKLTSKTERRGQHDSTSIDTSVGANPLVNRTSDTSPEKRNTSVAIAESYPNTSTLAVEDGIFQYSRVEFLDGKEKEKLEYNESVAKRGAKAKRLREGIRSLTKEQTELDKLPEEERKKTEKDLLMDKAIRKVSGERVLDNLRKLKERQKSLFNRKKASKRKWAERMDTQQEELQGQVQRRKEKLDERQERKRLRSVQKGKLNFFNLANSTDPIQTDKVLSKFMASKGKSKSEKPEKN